MLDKYKIRMGRIWLSKSKSLSTSICEMGDAKGTNDSYLRYANYSIMSKVKQQPTREMHNRRRIST